MKVSLQIVLEELRKVYVSLGKIIKDAVLREQASVYHEKLSNVDQWVFVKACREWSSERIPTAFQLADACRKIQATVEQRARNWYRDEDFVCQHLQYFLQKNFEQSAAEAAMCMQKTAQQVSDYIAKTPNGAENLRTEAALSKQGYSFVLCPWHQSLARARHHPGGLDDIHCKLLLNPGDFSKVDDVGKAAESIFKKL